MKRSTFAFLLTIFIPVVGLADWPTYLSGNDRAAYTDQQLDLPLQPAWTYTSPAKPVKAWSGPRSAPIEGHEMRHRVPGVIWA